MPRPRVPAQRSAGPGRQPRVAGNRARGRTVPRNDPLADPRPLTERELDAERDRDATPGTATGGRSAPDRDLFHASDLSPDTGRPAPPPTSAHDAHLAARADPGAGADRGRGLFDDLDSDLYGAGGRDHSTAAGTDIASSSEHGSGSEPASGATRAKPKPSRRRPSPRPRWTPDDDDGRDTAAESSGTSEPSDAPGTDLTSDDEPRSPRTRRTRSLRRLRPSRSSRAGRSRAAASGGGTAGRSTRRWWVTAGALVLVIVAMIVIVTLLLLQYGSAQARDQARDKVPSVAKEHAAKILSYDYRHIEDDAKAAAEVTTGEFRAEYRKSMDELVIPQAPKLKAVVQAEVLSAGLSSVNDAGDQAVVIVYANQTVTNTQIEGGSRVDQVRIRITLDKHGDAWLVSKVDRL